MKKMITKIVNLILIVSLLLFSILPTNISLASTEIEPADNQYLELRATTIKEVDGQNKQVIMELWGYEIDFKRFWSTF